MQKSQTLRLGTRSSNLALTQSRMIAKMLQRAHPGLQVELVDISTVGDKVTDKPLKSFGGVGVFVKELEAALLSGHVDIAVHSLKDMPTRQPKGLLLGAIVGREDTRDVLFARNGQRLEDFSAGSVIGSGSTRRRAQLKSRFPNLEFAEIRGNVETRLRKVREGEFAATILARAGLKRLGLLEPSMQVLALAWMLPAPGQGAIGVECRAGDRRARRILSAIHNAGVAACVAAERSILEALGGGCHLPLGALGTIRAKTLRLQAVFGLPDGSKIVRAEGSAAPKEARALGKRVAKELLAQGGKEVLSALDQE
ncbi:MAG TPA: hydroxymethylbilane synthase [Planctomycetota bacterium]